MVVPSCRHCGARSCGVRKRRGANPRPRSTNRKGAVRNGRRQGAICSGDQNVVCARGQCRPHTIPRIGAIHAQH